MILAGFGSSHAHTFAQPDQWDARRGRTRARFAAKYGTEPPDDPALEHETLEGNRTRYATIAESLDRLKNAFEGFAPDALVLIGDDQNEHFRDAIPQFAIHTGRRFTAVERDRGVRLGFENDRALASLLLEASIDAGFDVVASRAFKDEELISHAHTQVLAFLQPEIPVVPVFVDAIHVPAPTPARCFAFGRALCRALESWGKNKRVAVYASGGFSHFSAGYPYEAYRGPHHFGSIAQDFDRDVVASMSSDAKHLGDLTSDALLENGDVELRQWITMLGVLDGRPAEWLVYEAFYRAIMGMAVGYWAPVAPERRM